MTDDIKYEPTRDHWTPYKPWMRHVLADDARVSWIGFTGGEQRATAGNIDNPIVWGSADSFDTRVHPDDAPAADSDGAPEQQP